MAGVIEGDCASGNGGSWPLGLNGSVVLVASKGTRRAEAASKDWGVAVARCAARCQSCSCCAFVSVSKLHNECLWYSELACTQSDKTSVERDGFRTYRVPANVPSSCVLEPAERSFATVLSRLSQLPVKVLRNGSALADLTREVGLVRDAVRPLYGHEKIHMHNRHGFGMYQLPEQVGCLLSELTSLPTSLRTFVEIGSWYGWTGLFFTVFARRLFESSLARMFRQQRRQSAAAEGAIGRRKIAFPVQSFRSASFDIYDMRSPCVKSLTAQYGHAFYQIPHGRKLKNRTRVPPPRLRLARAAASAWYLERFAESNISSASALREAASKIDLCFIDASHSFANVRADVLFFQPRCRLLLFHDIVDGDSYGVRAVWYWLSRGLRRERDRSIAKEGASFSNTTAWAVEQGYFVKECTQQAGTNRGNFGLGLISAQRLNMSWLHACTCRYGHCQYRHCKYWH